jgi:glucokinase
VTARAASSIRLVCVDIGGTHARFAIATAGAGGAITVGEPLTLQTRDHASFQTAWQEFARQQGGDLPRAVSIAVAAHVFDDVIHFTNNPWSIRPPQIAEMLGVDRWTVINDFGAVGHAVARADDAAYLHLCGPDTPLPATGTLSIVGPGTGLGVAHVWRDGKGGYRVQATEGGHVAFAPLDSIEDAILARLRPRHRRVSAERVVAGPAIVDIYETLAAIEGKAVAALDDRALWPPPRWSGSAWRWDRSRGTSLWRRARTAWSSPAGWACASATACSPRALPNASAPRGASKT